MDVVPVFCFDPRFYTAHVKTYEIRKASAIRTKFHIDSVTELRTSLESLNSHLLISDEKPEDFIAKLMRQRQQLHHTIVYQREICEQETRVEQAVHKSAREVSSTDFVPIWGSTLHHLDDVPFTPGETMPFAYGYYRKVNAAVKVRPVVPAAEKGELPAIAELTSFEQESSKFTPELGATFGFTEEQIKAAVPDKRSCYPFRGGEKAGLARLQEYLFTKKAVGHYNDTRNNLNGTNYSSKLSPWLANGTLSIRQVYHETRRFEKENSGNESTKVFIDELFWRDFNRYWFMHNAGKAFSSYGIYDRTYYAWKTEKDTV